MISKKIEDTFNGQLNAELYSSYLYLSMAAYLESIKLRGFAKWMRVQVEEENEHAMKFFEHIIERGGRVLLPAVAAPPKEWDGAPAVAAATCDHEKKVTGLIHDLVELAKSEGDKESEEFLQWFVAEQEEEEENVGKVRKMIEGAGGQAEALAKVDAELSKRGE